MRWFQVAVDPMKKRIENCGGLGVSRKVSLKMNFWAKVQKKEPQWKILGQGVKQRQRERGWYKDLTNSWMGLGGRREAGWVGLWKMVLSFDFSLSLSLSLSLLNTPQRALSKEFSSVESFRCVRLFATSWTAACQASLSITSSWSLLKLMSIESVMPSSHLILCRPLLLLPSTFPSIRVFSNEFFTSGSQSIGASASVLPMNIQDWFHLGWTGWISLLSKGLSRVFSNSTVQKHNFFGAQLSL